MCEECALQVILLPLSVSAASTVVRVEMACILLTTDVSATNSPGEAPIREGPDPFFLGAHTTCQDDLDLHVRFWQ